METNTPRKESPSVWEKTNQKMRASVSIRMITIGFLILILLIPTAMIRELIDERARTRSEAVQEVSAKWGNAQRLAGPVLSLPYEVVRKNSDGDSYTEIHMMHFLPEDLNIEVKLSPQLRKRGIYEVVVYESVLDISGSFPQPDARSLGIDPSQVRWAEASLSIGLSDMRGIMEQIDLQWNDHAIHFDPGANAPIGSGVSTPVPVQTENGSYTFSTRINLRGSESIYFSPMGRETRVKLYSDWETPSFDGAFLPDSRDVRIDGFDASWKVLHLNRSFPQQWIDSQSSLQSYDFGVRLKIPVDQYQKSQRAAKYAIMLIVLTFMVFFLVEVFQKIRIHPIQYILVGLALTLFYVLTLSVSEQSSFDLAYLVSAGATIFLISFYAWPLFKNIRLSAILAGMLVISYGFVYALLQMEDYALIIGSVGLFVVLAGVMYVTRKLDWYNLNQNA